ncbi:hypothetical protein CR513_51719, partial [Mucuna pruriens]
MKACEEHKSTLEEADRERRFLESMNKKAKWEEETRIKIKECLVAADWEMSLRRDERNQLLLKKLELEEELMNSRVVEQRAHEQFEDIKRQLENAITREQLLNERWEQANYQMSEDSVAFWKDRYGKLAWLANQVVQDVPRALRKAEGMINPLETQLEIISFLEFYKDLIRKIREMTVTNQEMGAM